MPVATPHKSKNFSFGLLTSRQHSHLCAFYHFDNPFHST